MRRAGWVSVAAAVAVAAYVGLDIADVVPGVLTTDRPVPAPTGAPAPTSVPAGAPAPSTASAGATRLVAAAATDLPLRTPDPAAPGVTPAALAARLTPLVADKALGPGVGVVVADGLTGQQLFAQAPAVPHEPASTTKLLTAAAVAGVMPSEASLDTTAVAGAQPGQVVLVGGGDMLLAPGAGEPGEVAGHAGLADLADQVVRSLGADHPATLSVVLDEGSLGAPQVDSAWLPEDVTGGYAGPVTALALATQRPLEGHPAPADPAMSAAQAFRDALRARGLTVADAVTRGAAPPDAARLGVVHSAPYADQVALALADSDNTLISALARVAALRAGVAPTFPAVTAWVLSRVTALGVPVAGVTLADPSGLAPGTRIPAQTIAALLTKATGGAAPDLARMYAGLPTAGLSGTLADRYLTGPQRAGAGLVHAKTGTLTGVSSLAGTVIDADGRLLDFVLLADHVSPDGTLEARDALDRAVTAVATCGCR